MIQYSYTFDPETRTLTPSGDPVNVKGDTNVVQIIFTMPASYEGLALSSYVWRVFYKISMNTKLEEVRFHQFTDQTTEGENLVLTWTVTNSVTEFAGHLGFALSGTLTDTGGNVTNRINSIPAYERIEPTIGGGSYTEDDAEIEGIKDFLVGIQEAAEAAQAAAETAAAEAEASAARAEQIADELEPYKSLAIVESASGDPATFTDGSNGVPMKSVSVSIEPVQSGSGDPSPDNVRPISGWDEVKVTRTGKNLLPIIVQRTVSGVTITPQDDGSVVISGSNTVRDVQIQIMRATLPTGRYTISGGVDSVYKIRVGSGTGSFIAQSTTVEANFTLTEPTTISVSIRVETDTGTSLSATVYPMLRVYGQSSTFEKQSQQTYPISLTSAGTVYGGTLDVSTGELVVDRIMIPFSSFTGWVYNAQYFYASSPTGARLKAAGDTNIISDIYKNAGAVAAAAMPNGTIKGRASDNMIFVHDDRATTTSALLALIGDNQTCYTLATPLTYTLTTTQITSLFGTNHVWADCGEVSCEYVADTKMYIDKIVASL